MLLRKIFDLPLTKEQLNKGAMNLIPDYGIVPRIDDAGSFWQRI